MNAQTKALWAALVAGVTGFIAWVSTIPPEVQSGLMATLLDVFPVSARPTVGAWCKLIMTIAGIYGTYQATKSGPKPPTQPLPA